MAYFISIKPERKIMIYPSFCKMESSQESKKKRNHEKKIKKLLFLIFNKI